MSRPFPSAFDPRSVITVPLLELCLLDLKSVTDTEGSCVTPSSTATSEQRVQAPTRLKHRTASGKGPGFRQTPEARDRLLSERQESLSECRWASPSASTSARGGTLWCLARLCTFETDIRKTQLIKACKVGSTWYAAAKVTSLGGSPDEDATYVTDADGSITFGAVFLTRYDDGCWGYKDMEESAGPMEFRASLNLLALLSELKDTDSYAHIWFQRCQDWAATPEYEYGDRIKLAAPVMLTDGSTCQIVTATYYRLGRQKRRCYHIEEAGGLLRLSKATLAGSELLISAKSLASAFWLSFWWGRGPSAQCNQREGTARTYRELEVVSQMRYNNLNDRRTIHVCSNIHASCSC